MTHFWNVASALSAYGQAFIVVTLVKARGHVPQELGAKAVVSATGLQWGTVGGGKLEAFALKRAQEYLCDSLLGATPQLCVLNLRQDLGMSCGGEVTLLFEAHSSPSWEIVVFGAGHVAQALVPILATLDCRVTCVDPRIEWLGRLPPSENLRTVLQENPADLVAKLAENAYMCVLTQGHSSDLPILVALAQHQADAPFIGVIGSTMKAGRLRKDLATAGVADAFLDRIHCPIGLSLGASRPSEIAISITAQLLHERDRLRESSLGQQRLELVPRPQLADGHMAPTPAAGR